MGSYYPHEYPYYIFLGKEKKIKSVMLIVLTVHIF